MKAERKKVKNFQVLYSSITITSNDFILTAYWSSKLGDYFFSYTSVMIF